MMPAWLQVISKANPLTYEVDALRAMMLSGGTSAYGIGNDLAVLVAATTCLVLIAGKLHPRVVI